MKIDWYYHRKGCDSCKVVDALLVKKQTTPAQIQDASIRWAEKDVVKLLKEVTQVNGSRGRKAFHYDLKKSDLDHADMMKSLLGPYGTLKAPSIRIGKKLYVGMAAVSETLNNA